MTQLVVLKLDGDLQQGVRVTFSIANEGVSPRQEVTGNLPPIEQLQTTIDQWRSNYRSLGGSTRALKAKKVTYSGSINHQYKDCKNSARELQKQLNNWLRSESFRPIRETWLKELPEKESVRVLVRTSSQKLRQIPWHLWDLLEEYPQAELALSATNYQKPITAKTPTYREKVKILAILGNSRGIDVETDRSLLNSLPDAEVTFLVQPRRQEISDSLWSKHWDILFFAGHSQTVENSGRIYINENQEYLTIDDLKYGLRQAVNNGLALAIFNSCDGLGLVSELEALHIPQMIVMREPVPDEAARVFLKHFLLGFANLGQPLYQAAKEARLKLHGLEDKYPCVSWLPIIYQNAGTTPPHWLDLGRRPTQISPYRGLFAFREEDSHLFFGREYFIKMLAEAVQQQPLVAVIGSSGSGKSSVVFAGLVNRLRNAGNWQIVNFRPGARPLFSLATALVSQKETHPSRAERLRSIRNLAADFQDCENGLRDVVDDILCLHPNQRLLLVADQFEELYTLCGNTRERNVFLDRLLEAIYNCRNFSFVITLRADFLGQALSYRPFADALQYADLKLGSMTPSELQDAVEKPAALLGVTIEQGLTERIVSAVSAEPGDLPLLEFALTQLWAKQRDARLTHAAYDEIGGVEAALAHFADEAYQQLNFEEQERARRIFIQLVHPGEGTEDTRRIATRGEVGEENWALVTRLADARLVVTGYDEKTGSETVEIVHEALIRRWGQLQRWMQQDRDFRYWQEQLRAAMRTWESSGCDEGGLLRGKPLFDAEDWYGKRFLELGEVERDFIRLSGKLKERENQKQKRRRKLTISGLSTGLVVALILAFTAWQHSQKSIKNEIDATIASAQLLLNSRRDFEGLIASLKASVKLKEMSGHLTFKNGTENARIRKEVESLLQEALYKVRELNRLEKHLDEVTFVSFSPDGQIIATASADKTVKLWNLEGNLIKTLAGHRDKIYGVSFSPDGETIATASVDKSVKLWNLEGNVIKTLAGHRDKVFNVSFSPDGETIATASADQTVKLWSRQGQKLRQLTEFENWVRSVAWSPDGQTIATASKDGTVKLWDANGRKIKTLVNQGIEITSVNFSPDGKMIAATDTGRKVKLWNLNGEKLQTFAGHKDWVWSSSFSFDGDIIATASKDKTVKLWRLNRKKLQIIPAHTSKIYGISLSQDGEIIATASADKTVKLWSREGSPIKTLAGLNSDVTDINFSSDGQKIATVTTDGTVQLWTNIGTHIRTFQTHKAPVYGVTFSPDGRTIATASDDGTAKLWSLNGEETATLKGHDDRVNSVAWSPDGRTIATASWDYSVKLWSAEGTEIKTLKKHQDGVYHVSFSPDGQTIATASEDKTVRLWTIQGQEIGVMEGHDAKVFRAKFSPDGNRIATASGDYTVRLWTTQGQEIKTFKGENSDVTNLSFSSDGHTLASSDDSGNLILWDLDLQPGDLQRLACNWVGDYLETNPKVSKSYRHLCDGIRDGK